MHAHACDVEMLYRRMNKVYWMPTSLRGRTEPKYRFSVLRAHGLVQSVCEHYLFMAE